MIKQWVMVNRLPDLDRAVFLDHWRNTHAPLVKSVSQVLGIRRYVQTTNFPDRSGLASLKQTPWDGIAEVWFDNIDIITTAHREPAAREAIKQLKADEQRFIDQSRTLVFWGEEVPIFDRPVFRNDHPSK